MPPSSSPLLPSTASHKLTPCQAPSLFSSSSYYNYYISSSSSSLWFSAFFFSSLFGPSFPFHLFIHFYSRTLLFPSPAPCLPLSAPSVKRFLSSSSPPLVTTTTSVSLPSPHLPFAATPPSANPLASFLSPHSSRFSSASLSISLSLDHHPSTHLSQPTSLPPPRLLLLLYLTTNTFPPQCKQTRSIYVGALVCMLL